MQRGALCARGVTDIARVRVKFIGILYVRAAHALSLATTFSGPMNLRLGRHRTQSARYDVFSFPSFPDNRGTLVTLKVRKLVAAVKLEYFNLNQGCQLVTERWEGWGGKGVTGWGKRYTARLAFYKARATFPFFSLLFFSFLFFSSCSRFVITAVLTRRRHDANR